MKTDNRFVRQVYTKCLLSSFFAILGSAVGQIVNGVVVGNILGTDALSVLSLVVPVYYIFAVFGNMLGIGGSSVCSSLMGKNRYRESSEAFTVTYIWAAVLSACFTAVTLLVMPWLIRLLGAGEAQSEGVFGYCAVMAAGGVFTVGVYLAFNFLRLDGKNTASMLVFIIMAVVNTLLDVLFTLAIPLGLIGVSLATSLASAVSALMGAVLLFFFSKNFKLVKMSFSDFATHTRSIFGIGSPGAVENVSILAKSLILNRVLIFFAASAATVMLSAVAVINSVNSFALAIIAGSSGAIVPFISVFAAEKDTVSMKQVLKISLKQGLGLTAVFTLICLALAPQIAGLFGVSGDGLPTAVTAIRLFSLSFLPAQLNCTLISLHLSNGHTAVANLLTVLRGFLLIISAAVVLCATVGTGAVWHCFWIAETGTLIAAAVVQFAISRKNRNLDPFTLIDLTTERNGTFTFFTVTDRDESVSACIEHLNGFCEENELSPKRTMLISLSLEEMLNSVRTHSISGVSGETINVRLTLIEDVIVLRIRNGGRRFNPVKYYEDKRAAVDPTDIDGMLELDDSLGIKMIVDAADVVDYRCTFGVNNLTIIM